MISAIILAAGKSERMGNIKLTMPLGISTLIEEVVDAVLRSKAGETIVVLGHESKRIKQAIDEKPVKLVINKEYCLGMSTSIKAGMKAIDDNCLAVMIVLGDQPTSPNIINTLIESYENSDRYIVLPTYRNVKGHPVLFDIRYKDQLLSLNGDEGGRRLIEQNPDDVLYVPTGSESVVRDIDTPDDYNRYVESCS
jgi:molybdenum cofactor cytidylyltransferase